MSRDLNDLTAAFRPLADEVIAQWLVAHPGNPLVITFTLRTQAEQDAAVAAGRSQTHHGKHLPQPPDMKAWAMDVCPESLITQENWAPDDPLWWKLGAIITGLGLMWGGQWRKLVPPPVGHPPTYRGSLWDPGHAEWLGPVIT